MNKSLADEFLFLLGIVRIGADFQKCVRNHKQIQKRVVHGVEPPEPDASKIIIYSFMYVVIYSTPRTLSVIL